jgi:ribosomal protein S18 acetylase RimI-like enzyme
MRNVQIRRNSEAVARLEPIDIVELTHQATRATFYIDGLTAEQVKANERIPQMSGQAFLDAASAEHQHLAAAFEGGRLTGFSIATQHAPDDLELDWLMVHPARHGSGLAAALMEEGIGWLGERQSIWLTVIRHNARAIRFYRKFGFEIDQAAELNRPVPTWVMRRKPAALPQIDQ